jgi:hypothetical protein
MMSAKINRAALAAIAAFVLSTSAVHAQGKSTKPVVIPKAVLKSMIANKPKSKTPLGAKAGIVKRKGVLAVKPQNAPQAAVREVPKKN